MNYLGQLDDFYEHTDKDKYYLVYARRIHNPNFGFMALGKLHKEIGWVFDASKSGVDTNTLEFFELTEQEIIEHIVIPNI